MKFIRKLNRKNFYFQATVLKFCDLLRGWKSPVDTKFQHNIFKFKKARPKKHRTWGMNIALYYVLSHH